MQADREKTEAAVVREEVGHSPRLSTSNVSNCRCSYRVFGGSYCSTPNFLSLIVKTLPPAGTCFIL